MYTEYTRTLSEIDELQILLSDAELNIAAGDSAEARVDELEAAFRIVSKAESLIGHVVSLLQTMEECEFVFDREAVGVADRLCEPFHQFIESV